MPGPRLSIARLMASLAMVALNCGLLRWYLLAGDNSEFYGSLGVFLMVNVLSVGAFRLLADGLRTRPFLVGFEVAGLMAVLAYLACIAVMPGRFVPWLSDLTEPIEEFCETYLPTWLLQASERRVAYARALLTPIALLAFGVPLALPQLLVALGGGMLARRFARRTEVGRAETSIPAIGPTR